MLEKLPVKSLSVGNDTIKISSSARNIGAFFDSTLSMSNQVNHICKNAWHHLGHLGQIRQYLDTNSAKTLMHSYVS